MQIEELYAQLNAEQQESLYYLLVSMLPKESKDIVPLPEAAKLLGVSNAVVRGMVEREEVRCQKLSRKTWLVSYADCKRKLAKY